MMMMNELSVVSVSKCPKELKGYNKLETTKHWATPTRQREWKRPTDIYVLENNVGSPVLSIDSPLIGTRRTLVTGNYVGTWVVFKCLGVVSNGTVKLSCIFPRNSLGITGEQGGFCNFHKNPFPKRFPQFNIPG